MFEENIYVRKNLNLTISYFLKFLTFSITLLYEKNNNTHETLDLLASYHNVKVVNKSYARRLIFC